MNSTYIQLTKNLDYLKMKQMNVHLNEELTSLLQIICPL